MSERYIPNSQRVSSRSGIVRNISESSDMTPSSLLNQLSVTPGKSESGSRQHSPSIPLSSASPTHSAPHSSSPASSPAASVPSQASSQTTSSPLDTSATEKNGTTTTATTNGVNTSHTAGSKTNHTQELIPTYFTNLQATFKDVKMDGRGNIPTESFLNACRSILPIIDKMNHTAFAPVTQDIAGNIKKLQEKYWSNPSSYFWLQSMILAEVQTRQHRHSNSATNALLWLKRSLEFIVVFSHEFLQGTDDLTIASNRAYTKTLKPFHNFVNRGIYALAEKSAPSKQEFLHHLSLEPIDSPLPDIFEACLKEDLQVYIAGLSNVLEVLHIFYLDNTLDFPDMV